MKFEDFKVGDYIIWTYDGDRGIIKKLEVKFQIFHIEWYDSKIPFVSQVNYSSSTKFPVILDKSTKFNDDMKDFLNE